MSVDSEESRVQYIATSGQTNFGFNFKIFVDTDIDVYLTPVGQTPDPISDKLVLITDYTVNILDQSGSIDLITSATTGDIITIEREIPATRSFDYGVGGSFTGPSLDTQLDKLTIQIAQNKSRQDERGLIYSVTDQLTELDNSIPQLESDQFWKKSASGEIIAVECTDNDGCSTLRSEIASETLLSPGTDLIGYYDPIDFAQTLTEKLSELAPQKDDRAVAKNATDGTKLVKLDASSLTTGTTRTITMADRDIDLDLLGKNRYSPGYLYGFPYDLDAGDLNHDVIFGAGNCRDATDTIDIDYASTMTKQIDAVWAQGSDSGGFPSSLTPAIFTWYHCFIIVKEDGTIDFGWDSDLSATNLLADATDFIYYRRIGSNILSPGLNLFPYIYRSASNRRIVYFSPTILIYNATDPGAAAVLVNSGCPTGIEAYVSLNVVLYQSGTDHTLELYITNPDVSDEATTISAAPLCTIFLQDTEKGNEAIAQNVEVLSNASSQVRFRLAASFANTEVRICTLGWSEHL